MENELPKSPNKDNIKKVISVWQICPKCSGQGKVSKPPYLSGDINHWSSSQPNYECNLCDGKMIINVLTGKPPKN